MSGLRRILLGSNIDMQIGDYQNSVVFRKHSVRLQNVINYAVLQGYTKPDFYYLEKLDAFLIAIEPLLQRLDVFYLFAGEADKKFKMINICDPEKYEAAEFGGTSWSNTGVKGNGIDAYIDTKFIASIDVSGNQKYKIDNASRGFLIKDYSSTWQHWEGLVDADQEQPVSSNVYRIVPEGNASIITKPEDVTWLQSDFYTSGFHTITRLNNIDTSYFLNAQQIQTNRMKNSKLLKTSQVLFKADIQASINTYETKYSKIGLGFYFIGGNLDISFLQMLKSATNQFYSSIGLSPIIP